MRRISRETRLRIIGLAIGGKSRREIAAEIGCARASVDRIVNAYKYENRIADAARTGRPSSTSKDEDLAIIATVNLEPSLSLTEIRRQLSLNVSLCTIRRRLAQAGLRSRIACQRPRLSPREKGTRLVFVEDHLSWKEEDWCQVVFSDESTFVSRWDQQRVWRLVGTRYDPDYIKTVASSGRCSVSVWGFMTWHGLGPLFRIEGTLTSEKYLEILQHVLLPYLLDGDFPDGLFVFQQDRSPIHTAKKVKQCLDQLGVIVLEWPPKGADLNVIENVWGLMKKHLGQRSLQEQSRDHLWSVVQEEWERLRQTPDLVKNLYRSLPGRALDVVEAKGSFRRH